MIEEARGRPACRSMRLAAGFGIAALLAGAFAGLLRAEPRVSEVRISRHEGLTRISIALSEGVRFHAYVLGAPYRIVIDLPRVDWRLRSEARLDDTPITAWRFGGFSKDVMRIVFDLDRPMRIQNTFTLLAKDGGPNGQLVIDLGRISREEFDRIQREQRGRLPDYTAPGDEAREGERARRDAPLVVLDPGHGGIDPGATGKGGTNEKDIVLLVARDLRDRILASGRYRVLMTRGADYYIALRQRFEIARSAGADIFISLHADSSPLRASRGLSVYTLSTQASDAEAAALARRENRADIVAGVDIPRADTRVAGILIDLAQRRSLHNAHLLASTIVAALEGRVTMVPKPQRAAGFAVLKAPDVPSVLIEMGHLSNPREEHLLRDPVYRGRLADSLLQAIDRYFATKVKKTPIRRTGAEADALR